MGRQQQIFSRDSTGLVREISAHQAFIYNFMAIGLCTFTWVTLYSIAYSQPFLGSSVGLAILLMAVAAIPFYLCTSMLSAAMPRSGGDYVWQSRVLHPALGFASTFSAWTVWQWYFASFLGVVITTIGFQPYFALLGQSNSYLSNLAASLAADYGFNTSVFWVTTAIILLGLLIAAAGMKFYVRLQYLLFAGSAASAVTILYVLATTSHASFVTAFNKFTFPLVEGQGNSTLTSAVQSAGGYYQYILNTANISTPVFSWGSTVALMAIIWVSFGYAFWSIYNLSEIKRAGSLRTHAWAQVGSSLLFAVFLLALWYLLESVVGLKFLDSFYTLFYNFDASTNPIAFFYTPYYPALVASISTNPWVWGLILGGLTFGIFQVILIVYFASTRIMLASSIDRVLPEKVSYVNSRTHSPLAALLISALGCEAFLYLIIYHTSITSYFSTAGLATQIAYVLISVTAIAFPFRKKEIFESSPIAKYRVAGFPLLSLLGVLALIVNLYIGYVFVAGPSFTGLTVPTLSSIEFVVGIFAACLVAYLIAWGVRKKQGIDLSLSFSEIPPE
ncbi:MAG: amino acid permease [Nitrososphaerota archaeon]|nr:amino acid permease [Nitrososphaerota archaeon]